MLIIGVFLVDSVLIVGCVSDIKYLSMLLFNACYFIDVVEKFPYDYFVLLNQ